MLDQDHIINFLSIGMILMMMMHMALRYITERDINYGYYCLYLCCMLLYLVLKPDIYALWSNDSAYFMNNPQLPVTTVIFQVSAYYFYFLFVSKYLSLKNTIPGAYKVTIISRWLILSYIFCFLFAYLIHSNLSILKTSFDIIRICLSVVSLYAIIEAIKLKNKLANFFVWGNTMYLLFALIAWYLSVNSEQKNMSLWIWSLFANLTTAIIIETSFMTLGLSYKNSLSEKERIHFQNLFISELQEKQRIQLEFNHELEEQVKSRTNEIIKLKQLQFIQEKKQALELEKTRIASDIHDDISSGLTAINLIAHNIKNSTQTNALSKSIDYIVKSSNEINQRIREIIWTINVDNDSLLSLFEFVKKFLTEISLTQKINVDYSFPTEVPQLLIPSQFRQNIYLVIKEAVNNSLKYSGADLITVTFNIDNNILHLEITDNGNGFEYENIIPGNGIKNMKKRIEDLDGSIRIFSKDCCKIEVEIEMPA